MENNSETGKPIRELLQSEERLAEVTHTIDPGFIHHRRIQTIIGPEGRNLLDRLIRALPPMPDWQREVRIDHIFSDVMLSFCKLLEVKSLEELVATRKGRLFCSTEEVGPCPNLYDVQRAMSPWIPPGERDIQVEFLYSTRHIRADTLRSELHRGSKVSIIAELQSEEEGRVIFNPLVMGFPWLTTSDPKWADNVAWWRYQFFENVIEDFSEFARVKDFPKPNDCLPMKYVSEAGFKACLADILGGVPPKDWGGETSDFFTAHLHLNGKRIRGAFLLKGPARFEPMTLDRLGKRNDQIVRLAHEPAEVLFVQHCHEITPPVRSTLRAFAVQPSNPRRYCLIDGRDSLWLLQAYGLYDKARKSKLGK